MENENDKKILQLKEVVTKKKEEIKILKGKNEAYKTNLVLQFDEAQYNLHVLSRERLKLLLVKLSLYNKEAKELELDLEARGFPLSDWIADVKTQLRQITISHKEQQLKVMEETLDKKLSQDTKNKIELDQMDKLLGEFDI
jgi:hypothetical protein